MTALDEVYARKGTDDGGALNEARVEVLELPAGPVRLHLGCGLEHREGWINVDARSSVDPDVVARVDALPMFADGSVDTIEACHLFEHLTRLPFGFYDRVQSGQIISRANSDIRSVQLFLAFAPLMGMSLLSFVVALGFMLTVHVGLTLVALAALPGVYLVGLALRNRQFPLSWIIQGRVAEVATIVDENINGVRVVKSFAAERRQINQLAKAARRLQWANIATVDSRARYAPLMENLPRIGLALGRAYLPDVRLRELPRLARKLSGAAQASR